MMKPCRGSTRNFEKDWLKLEQLGVPLEPPEFRVPCRKGAGLRIEQAGCIASNMLLELHNGAVGCILDVVLVSDVAGTVFITDRTLELPWSSEPVQWLPGVDSIGDEVDMYEFPGEKYLVYASDVVSNHRINERGVLKRGDRIAGLLLGVTWDPIPETYRHGCSVCVRLRVFDQFHREYGADFTLFVDRGGSLTRRKTWAQPRRTLVSK